MRLEGRPGDQPERGAQPFNTKQLTKLRQAVGADSLAFILLRWTGLRGSDAVGLRWEEIDWETREINRLTLKRRKRVILPIHQELFFALEIEFSRRNPQPEDRVLQNLSTRKPFTRPRLHERMLALGRRAGELDAPRIVSRHVRCRSARSRSFTLRCREVARRHGRDHREALRPFRSGTARAREADHGNRRRVGTDSGHTAGTAKTCGRENQLSRKEIVADEPVSRILCAASRSLTCVSGDWRSRRLNRD